MAITMQCAVCGAPVNDSMHNYDRRGIVCDRCHEIELHEPPGTCAAMLLFGVVSSQLAIHGVLEDDKTPL